MSIEKFEIYFISEEERLLFYEALVAYNKDCFNAAIALFSEALELNAANAETYRHRATCYCRMAEFKNAYFDSRNFTEAESCFMNIINPFVVKTTCRFTQSGLVNLVRLANYKLGITRYLMDNQEDAIDDLLGFLWEEPESDLEYFYHEVASLILEDITHSDVIGDKVVFKYGFAL